MNTPPVTPLVTHPTAETLAEQKLALQRFSEVCRIRGTLAWLEHNAPLIIWRGSVANRPRVDIHRANLDGTGLADTSDDPQPLGFGTTLEKAVLDAQHNEVLRSATEEALT